MRASGLRLVENFLDMAHFPYIHTDVLGAEPHTEVPHYASEIRREVDEVWAGDCQFYQPQIVANGNGGMVQLTYRVPSPFSVMLYRVCPSSPKRLDVIAMFIQPMEQDLCRALPVMHLVDDRASQIDLLKFEAKYLSAGSDHRRKPTAAASTAGPAQRGAVSRRPVFGHLSALAEGKGSSIRHRRRTGDRGTR